MEQIISSFLLYLKIPISRGYVERLIQSHQNYPSLLSVVDVFERLNIQYHVRRLTKDELKSLAFPYLLHLEKEGGAFVAVKSERDANRHKEDLRFWKGTVIQALPTFEINDSENAKLHKDEKLTDRLWVTLVTAICGLQLIGLFQSFSWPAFFLALTSVFGLLIGCILQAKAFGKRYQALETFCTYGKNMDCDKVLSSNKAQFGFVRFSDLVLSYFALQQTLLLSLSAGSSLGSASYTLMLIMGALTLPFILYSVYYQVRIKIYCALCLAIDAILIAQVIIFCYSFFTGLYPLSSNLYYIVLESILGFVMIAAALELLKLEKSKNRNFQQAATIAIRVKHSTSVFTYLLFQQKKVDTQPFSRELSLGQSNAPVRIIMASNLFCNPCKIQHEQLSRLMRIYPGKVHLTIRFVHNVNNPSASEAVKYFLNRWLSGNTSDDSTTEKLLSEWYTAMNLEKFKKLCPLELDQQAVTERLAAIHSEWVSTAGISETPTFYVNGFQLPSRYSVDDLMSLIPDLSDYFSKVPALELSDALEIENA